MTGLEPFEALIAERQAAYDDGTEESTREERYWIGVAEMLIAEIKSLRSISGRSGIA